MGRRTRVTIEVKERIMFFRHNRRPALARVARNSNTMRFAPARPDEMSTLDGVMERVSQIPPSARARLSGSPTVYAR